MHITTSPQSYALPYRAGRPQEIGAFSDPQDLKVELISLSRRGQLAYHGSLTGLAGMTVGAGTVGLGLWLHSAQIFNIGLSVGCLGAALLPISMMNLYDSVDKAERVDHWLRQSCPQEFPGH